MWALSLQFTKIVNGSQASRPPQPSKTLASMGASGVAITTTAGKTVIVQGPDL
jgi:hypothetical protein